jgi:hypothetical protein
LDTRGLQQVAGDLCTMSAMEHTRSPCTHLEQPRIAASAIKCDICPDGEAGAPFIYSGRQGHRSGDNASLKFDEIGRAPPRCLSIGRLHVADSRCQICGSRICVICSVESAIDLEGRCVGAIGRQGQCKASVGCGGDRGDAKIALYDTSSLVRATTGRAAVSRVRDVCHARFGKNGVAFGCAQRDIAGSSALRKLLYQMS